jgi:PAS domain-containing protein
MQSDRVVVVEDSFAPEAGVYTWVIESNLLYGDSLIADLFGLDPKETERGLPMERYAARLHQDDLAEVQHLSGNAMLTGQPFHAEHRLKNAVGDYRWVIATGRCFQDTNSMPLVFSGIVYPIDQLG